MKRWFTVVGFQAGSYAGFRDWILAYNPVQARRTFMRKNGHCEDDPVEIIAVFQGKLEAL